MSQEVIAAVEKVNQALADFRAANDARDAQIKAHGTATAELTQQVAKANAELGKLHAEVLALKRPQLVGVEHGATELSDEQAAAAFLKTLKVNQAKNVPNTFGAAEMRAYTEAFKSYLRGGTEFMPSEYRSLLQIGKDGDGGFFSNPTMDGRIVQRIWESSPMREICSVVSIGSDSYKFIYDDDESSVGYTSEIGTRTEGDTPEVAEGQIFVHELYAEPHATTKVLEDSEVDIEGWLTAKAGDKFARFESAEFCTASANRIRGILGRSIVTTADATRARGALQYIPTGNAGAFASTAPGDCLVTALYTLKAAHRRNAAWLMSSLTESTVRALKDGQGNYLWQPDYQLSGGATLLGRPVRNAEDMPAIAANSYSIAVGDFKAGYLIVDRRGLTLLRDPLTTKGRVKFHFTKRVGGDVIDSEAIKAIKFAAS